jgi:drug/metabolite transporter (DMT)-like permease
MKTRTLDVLMIVFVCVIWAGNYFVIKGVLPFVGPITFAFLRAILGGIFVFAIGGYAVKGITRRDILWLMAMGLFNVTFFLILLNSSLLTVNEGVSSTLVYTQPVVVVALSPLMGEKLTRRRVIGIAAAFAGIVVIFLPSILSSALVVGDLFALGASVSWATAILVFKRMRSGLNAYAVTAIQSVIGGIFILPALAFEHPYVDPTMQFWLFLGYNVILASGIAYMVYWKILTRMPASQFTSYFFLVPVFATVMASMFQFSVPPVNEIAGTLFVAAGIIIVNR